MIAIDYGNSLNYKYQKAKESSMNDKTNNE